MKTLIIAAAMLAAAVPAVAQTSVSINVGQPGFYGHIDLGGYAPPPVYYTQPVIVERQVRYVGQPVYLRVPEGHRKHWNQHCRQYDACGQQVFFVQDGWYNNTYAPRYRDQHRPVMVRESGYRGDGRRDERYDGRRDERYDGRRDERHDDHGRDEGHGHGNGHDRENDHGNGNGHGNGHGKHGD